MEHDNDPSILVSRMLSEFPYLPSPQHVIDIALDLAKPRANDIFADLGCGDGAVLIRAAERFSVFSVGFEIDGGLASAARENAKTAGVGRLVDVVRADLFTVDVSKFDVVYVYPFPLVIRRLSEKIAEECRKGSRILTHDIPLEHLRPTKALHVPDGALHTHTVYLYKT